MVTAYKVHMGNTKCTHNLVHMYTMYMYMYSVHACILQVHRIHVHCTLYIVHEQCTYIHVRIYMYMNA